MCNVCAQSSTKLYDRYRKILGHSNFRILENRAVLKHPKLLKTVKNWLRTINLYVTSKIRYFRCRVHNPHYPGVPGPEIIKNLEVLDDFQLDLSRKIFGVVKNP